MSRYFDQVVAAVQARGIELVTVYRGATELGYGFEIPDRALAGGPLARYASVFVWWRADEPIDGERPETGQGWYWTPYSRRSDQLACFTEDLVVDSDVPVEVAAAVAAVISGGVG